MYKIFIFIFSVFIFLLLPNIVNAGILPPCTATGDCGFCDMLFTVNAIMRWIATVSGSLALLYFIFGGIMFLASAGDKGRITKGRNIIINSIIGLLIVFTAWTAVNFIVQTASGSENIFNYSNKDNNKWYNLCNTGNECEGRGDGYPCANRKHVCINGKCDSTQGTACEWFASHSSTYTGFSCKHPVSNCGLIDYNDCDNHPDFCIKGLCPNGIEEVCCKPIK